MANLATPDVSALEVAAGLSDLIGHKDRQTLDHALVALVRKSVASALGTIGMYRCVGDAGEEHWFTCTPTSAQLVPELHALKDFPLRLQALRESRLVQNAAGRHCIALFPMTEGVNTVGVLEIESAQPLTADDQAMVEVMLTFYGNLQGLLAYGERDTLTDLLNRKTFEGSFMKATVAQEREASHDSVDRRNPSADQPGTHTNWLAMIDIDHFKRVNDNFGHLIGDEVLLLLARLMRTNFRFQDQLYRFGGEEFVVLMQNVSPNDAAHVFERLRSITQAHSFPQVGSITVSIGYSALRPGDTPDSAFARADKAVYYAKAHGRNQSCNFEALVAQGHLVEADANIGEIELF